MTDKQTQEGGGGGEGGELCISHFYSFLFSHS